MRGLVRSLIVVLGVLVPGCLHLHPHGLHSGHAKVMAHFHSDSCGHVFIGGSWVEIPAGHIHGPACGHIRVGGGWHAVQVKIR